MENMSLTDRAKLYSIAFPKYPALQADSRWISGMWILGQNYIGSGYYGSYPPSYLKRILSIFPDVGSILHLFSGSLDKDKIPRGDISTRIDINPALNPDIVGSAEDLISACGDKKFDLILADPPYSKEDAIKYNTPMPNRKKVIHECYKVLNDDGYLVWLDTVLPMYRKTEFQHCGAIGIVRSTNHRFRLVSIFKKNNSAQKLINQDVKLDIFDPQETA